MGRLATYVAGRASSADKLPGQLPNVSLIDALLPRIVSGSLSPRKTKVSLVGSDTGQPLGDRDQDRDSSRGSITHTDVTKDMKGRLVLVQHRDKSVGDGGGQATLEVVKKDEAAVDGSKDGENKNGAVDENEFKFTADEDAKFSKMKAENPTMEWAKVGLELNRPGDEAKARFNELKQLGKGLSGQFKGNSNQNDFEPENSNQNKSKQKDGKNGSGGDNKPSEGDWTAAEDAIIRGSKTQKTPKIAAKLPGRTKAEVGKRIQELNIQDETSAKNGGGGKDKSGQHAKGGGGKGQKKDDNKNQNKDQQKGKQESSSKKEYVKLKTPSKAGSKVGSKAGSKAGSSQSEAKFTMGEWMTLQEDDMFTFRELQLLSELIIADAKESRDGVYSWLRVASLFTDRTGRRVHPEDIHEKFEAMARD